MELKPSPWKHLWLLIFSGCFTLLGIHALREHPVSGWLIIGFFGSGVIIVLITLIPGSSYLRLEPEGMLIRSLYRTWYISWSDTSRFFVLSAGGQAMVCWNYTPGFNTKQHRRNLSRILTSVEAGLPDTYGYSAPELAGLLNQWRDTCLAEHINN